MTKKKRSTKRRASSTSGAGSGTRAQRPRSGPPEEGAERSEAPSGDGPLRGRPGRRSAADRRDAVLALFAGKASVDQIAKRFGVLPATVEKWREDALEGIESTFRQGKKSSRERELEQEVKNLRAAVTDISIRSALMEQALKTRPSRPGR